MTSDRAEAAWFISFAGNSIFKPGVVIVRVHQCRDEHEWSGMWRHVAEPVMEFLVVHDGENVDSMVLVPDVTLGAEP